MGTKSLILSRPFSTDQTYRSDVHHRGVGLILICDSDRRQVKKPRLLSSHDRLTYGCSPYSPVLSDRKKTTAAISVVLSTRTTLVYRTRKVPVFFLSSSIRKLQIKINRFLRCSFLSVHPGVNFASYNFAVFAQTVCGSGRPAGWVGCRVKIFFCKLSCVGSKIEIYSCLLEN